MNNQKFKEKVKEASDFIKHQTGSVPEIAIVLGSGLAYFGDKIETEKIIDISTIPHYPLPTVSGHQGKLIFGKVGKTPILAAKGRSHYYEGKDLNTITFYAHLFQSLGVKKLILTNAAGGVNPDFLPGDFVLIDDFINFGQVDLPWEKDYRKLLSAKLKTRAEAAARAMGTQLPRGIYCWTTGPSFETPAEVRAIRALGGDLAGMSTLPEAVVAHELGFEILGISLVTNQAAGISQNPLTHEEVKETADKIKEPYYHFMKNVINAIN
ncbi:MAG: purine-nucleoside phosphorylase [Candidatus Marinimicrobia bacterium]|nr:purine-nucleoside phosphorylase [Candidatus Neomarinimicrobiota bacterium]